MKRILLPVFLAVFSVSPLWADELVATTTQELPVETPSEFGPHQKWIERVEGTLGIPASSDATSALNLGAGGGLAFGYRLNSHLSVSVSTGYYQYGLKTVPAKYVGGFFSYVPLEMVTNYNIGEGTFRPYLSFGIGPAFNTYNLTSSSNGSTLQTNVYETSLLISPAIGFLQVIDPRAAIFVEARMDMDFRANGNSVGLNNGTPSIFVPIQAGLTFFVI
jgi:hypothetical protein